MTNGTIDSGQTGVVFDWTYNQASYKKELKDKGVNWKYKTFPKAQVVSYYNQAINKDARPPPACGRSTCTPPTPRTCGSRAAPTRCCSIP